MNEWREDVPERSIVPDGNWDQNMFLYSAWRFELHRLNPALEADLAKSTHLK